MAGDRHADVPVEVGLQETRQVGIRIGDRVVGAVQRFKIFLGPLGRGQFRAKRLQRLAGLHQIGEFDLAAADQRGDRGGHRRRTRTLNESAAGATRLDLHQVLDLENSKGLTYGSSAHLRLLDQFTLGREGGALLDLTVEDAFPQLASQHIWSLRHIHGAERDRGPDRTVACHSASSMDLWSDLI